SNYLSTPIINSLMAGVILGDTRSKEIELDEIKSLCVFKAFA
ncbi:9839_t:CDS:2, partial [Racocetra fulgida]